MKLSSSQLIYQAAAKFLGVSEVPGPASNPTIVGWINEAATWLKDEAKDIDGGIAWCGCFRGHLGIVTATGCPRDHYRAASWATWGAAVELDKPTTWKPGDTVILKRQWGNHVALFSTYDGASKLVELLGGNQSDKVCYSKFKLKDIISVRRLI